MSRITGLSRCEDTTIRAGGIGDNWHTSWASDDKQSTGLCDGTGWPDVPGYTGASYNSRIYGIVGNPPDFTFEHLPGYPELLSEAHPNIFRYYGFGILALSGYLYQFLSAPNHHFTKPDPRFVGVKLIYSPDQGKSWRNQNGGPVVWEQWEDRSNDNMVFFCEKGDAFSLITVLQMGRNYEANRDGYVYLYAPNGNTEGSMNQLVLCRVQKNRILDRSSYEFFTERHLDGSASWAAGILDRGVVHTFPSGWVNTQVHPYAWHPSVVYNEPLGVYLMANWGMGCSPDGMWFGKPGYLGFWTAPQPWGPWTQIYEDAAWTPANDQGARAYQPQIVPRWIAPDGKSFWLVWTDFQEIDGQRPYYSFNTQKVTLTTV